MGEKEREVEVDPPHFESILQHDVPKGRDGKHKRIVTQLLKHWRLTIDAAERIRSYISRSIRKKSAGKYLSQVGDEDKSLAIVQATRRTAYGVHDFSVLSTSRSAPLRRSATCCCST